MTSPNEDIIPTPFTTGIVAGAPQFDSRLLSPSGIQLADLFNTLGTDESHKILVSHVGHLDKQLYYLQNKIDEVDKRTDFWMAIWIASMIGVVGGLIVPIVIQWMKL